MEEGPHESHVKLITNRFSYDLETIERQNLGKKISIATLETSLQGRGFATLGLILCIPFIQPVPLPGLSILIGLALAIMGARIAVGSINGNLPDFIGRREIETKTINKILVGARKVFSYIERFFKNRLGFMLQPPCLNLVGVSIALSGLALSLPLPPIIMFSNSLPAWAIIFLCLGYLERDGLVIIIGHLLAIATWLYFVLWWEVVRYTFANIMRSFS